MGCELVKMPGGGSAFVCGGKKDHVCDWKLDVIVLLDTGRELKGTEKNWEKYKHMAYGSSKCSICGALAIDNVN